MGHRFQNWLRRHQGWGQKAFSQKARSQIAKKAAAIR
jgi:hypothetical protein